MPAIIDSLSELDLTAQDVTHVAVALGPGGFSAVRVGISAALGLAVVRQLPVLGVPTHDIEAAPYLSEANPDAPLYSLIPAGRNEISWTRHVSGSDTDPIKGISAPEELSSQLEAGALICGEACDLMAGHGAPSQFRGGAAPTRDPNTLLDLAIAKFGADISTPYQELRPIYARPPSISKPNPAK